MSRLLKVLLIIYVVLWSYVCGVTACTIGKMLYGLWQDMN